MDVDLSSSGEVVVGEVVEENLFGEEVGGGERDGINGGCDEVVDDDFLDPRCDTASVGSSTEVVEEFGRQAAECRSVVSNQGEFFDADEGRFVTVVSIVYFDIVCFSSLCGIRSLGT